MLLINAPRRSDGRRVLLLALLLVLARPVPIRAQVEVTKDNQRYRLSIDNQVVATSPQSIEEARAQAVPGTDIRFATWSAPRAQDDPDAPQPHFYSIKIADRAWSAPKQTSYMIKLKNRQFDPRREDVRDAAAASLPQPLRTPAADGPSLYLVQFQTQVLEPYRKGVEQRGGKVLSYLPELTHLVRMTPQAAEQVAQLPYVRWVGPMLPYYKADREILDSLWRNADAAPVPQVDVASRYVIVSPDAESRARLLERLQELKVPIAERGEGSRMVAAELTREQLQRILASDSVEWVERATKPEVDVDRARQLGGANFLEATPPGYTGIGIRGHVMEGIYSNHADFAANSHRQAPIAVNDPAPDDHGHQTYGEIFGSGAGDPQARGLLPNAQGLYTNYNFVYKAATPPGPTATGSRYELVGRLIRDHRIMFQTASWGYERTTEYTARSQEMDDLIFEHDIPITQSQSNAGNRGSRPQAWAKNIISVGGAYHFDNFDPSDDRWNNGASTGPASDGRIKPDLCAFYDMIKTTDGPTGYTTSFGGTSGATPIVAGHVGLCLEMWTNGIFGNPLPQPADAAHRFENRPHFTTVKALLICSARQYEFPPETDLSRERQGWGFPDLKMLYDLRGKSVIVNEDHVLSNLASRFQRVTVADDEPMLRVTMTYAEPGASPAAKQHRINNLDLKVTDPDGQVYWGNQGSLAGKFSTAGGSADRIDTVENVFVDRPKPGVWAVEVIADELNVDTHRETPELDADYALVVLGATAAP